MKELITEVASTSTAGGPTPFTTDDIASQYAKKRTLASTVGGPAPVTTDDIASQYEKKITQSIATKILASQGGSPICFTKEESAYLAKKAYEDGQFSEVKVITPDPTITLKKGKTEINIKNAATLVKKMEEIYPSPSRSIMPLTDGSDIPEHEINELMDELDMGVKKEVEDEPVRTMTSRGEAVMKNRFQKIVNHPISQVSPEVAKCVAPDEKIFQERYSNIKTVNKNAYEIRESVLGMALDFVKWQTETTIQLNPDHLERIVVPDDETLFVTAKKFYKFVEDRR